jgi:hypothetical protein
MNLGSAVIIVTMMFTDLIGSGILSGIKGVTSSVP